MGQMLQRGRSGPDDTDLCQFENDSDLNDCKKKPPEKTAPVNDENVSKELVTIKHKQIKKEPLSTLSTNNLGTFFEPPVISKNFQCLSSPVKTEKFISNIQNCKNNYYFQPAQNHQVPLPSKEPSPSAGSSFHLLRPDLKKCQDCQKKFDTQVAYTQHMRIFHPELIKCTLQRCNKFFRKQTELDVHLMKKHKSSVLCAICANIFSSKAGLQLHLLNQHLQKKKADTGKAKCAFCQRFFKNIYGHLKRSHPEKLTHCHLQGCCEVFSSEKERQDHLQKHHHQPVQCSYCDQTFEKKSLLVKHVGLLHKDVAGVRCSAWGCVQFFQSQAQMDRHYQESHPFHSKCDLCGYLASSRKVITHHIKRKHYPSFEKPKPKVARGAKAPRMSLVRVAEPFIFCGFCGQNVAESRWEKHRLSNCSKCRATLPCKGVLLDHKAECCVKCPLCDKQVRDYYDLKVHKLTHENWRGMKYQLLGIKCNQCRMFLSSTLSLQKHTAKVHDKIGGRKQFDCEFCKKSFANKYTIREHMVGEHKLGNKSFKCQKCPKRFYLSSKLKNHCKVHHGNLVECKNCGKVVKEYYFLKTHSKLCMAE